MPRDLLGLAEELHIADIAVLYMRPDVVADPARRTAFLDLLCDEECRRMDRFRAESDRDLFLVGHALVRLALSRHAGVDPRDWRFAAGPHGRPEIASPACSLRFTLSHTPGLAACAVVDGRDIGIDVEDTRRRHELSVADRFFAPPESLDVRSRPAGARHSRFLEYWTLKEAYIKATGRGLSVPLNSFAFQQDARGDWHIALGEGRDDVATAWRFSTFTVDAAQGALALAAATSATQAAS